MLRVSTNKTIFKEVTANEETYQNLNAIINIDDKKTAFFNYDNIKVILTKWQLYGGF